MNWKILSTLLIGAFYTSTSYSMLCPGNFNVINVGDPIATVEKLCGKPDSKEVADAPDNEPQEWSYYLNDKNNNLQIHTNAQGGTLKTTIAFDGDGKIINISVNGVGVASTNGCGQQIAMGMDRKTVENSCGRPSQITKQNQGAQPAAPADPNDMSNKMVTYIYNTTPPGKLVFIRGKLSE